MVQYLAYGLGATISQLSIIYKSYDESETVLSAAEEGSRDGHVSFQKGVFQKETFG